MHQQELHRWQHDHTFGTDVRTGSETKVLWVVVITFFMMVVEIVAGKWFGSMALLADGWHMGTHAAALGITFFAYLYARRHAEDAQYSFGTGKVSALGGFASAVGLGIVAVWIFFESVGRLASPTTIRFDEAILVACIGLVVNLGCAVVLREKHEHETDHVHVHHDHNLRGAYLHVLADGLTSVLAILALTLGKFAGWTWMDPMMGVVGAVIIARWSVGLLRDTSRVLLDAEIDDRQRRAIREAIEGRGDDRVADLHIWRVGPKHLAALISIVASEPKAPEHYKRLIQEHTDLVHMTVEVTRCPDAHARTETLVS